MMGLVGAKETFDEGRRDLEELSGVRVSTKALERASEATGARGQRECELAMADKPVWLKPERHYKQDVHRHGRDWCASGAARDRRTQRKRTGWEG